MKIDRFNKLIKHEKSKETFNIWYLDNYIPKYQLNNHNDEFSQSILDLKNRNLYSISFWTKVFSKFIPENKKFVVCCVPPSNPHAKFSGIREVAFNIRVKKKLIMGEHLLFRAEKVVSQKSRTKSIEEIKSSISFFSEGKQLVYNKHILLFDDIITTGNSIKACSEILIKHGAKKITVLTIGSTIRLIRF